MASAMAETEENMAAAMAAAMAGTDCNDWRVRTVAAYLGWDYEASPSTLLLGLFLQYIWSPPRTSSPFSLSPLRIRFAFIGVFLRWSAAGSSLPFIVAGGCREAEFVRVASSSR